MRSAATWIHRRVILGATRAFACTALLAGGASEEHGPGLRGVGEPRDRDKGKRAVRRRRSILLIRHAGVSQHTSTRLATGALLWGNRMEARSRLLTDMLRA